LDAIDHHRATLDAAALGRSSKDRDDVDNDLYNVAYLVRCHMEARDDSFWFGQQNKGQRKAGTR